jgi:carbon monoxide dehydrogenase subunit G
MKLQQSFEVAAPLEQVWNALIDVERVAPCLPGAAVTGRNQDGSYNGTFVVKIGPTTASYGGSIEMTSIDAESHTATMHANGTDKRGQGGARATIVSKLSEVDGRTLVEVDTDYSITGRLARFGRGGMIEDIAQKLLREFATRLQASLESESPAEAGAAPPEPAPVPEPAAPLDGASPPEPGAPPRSAAAAAPPEPAAVPEPAAASQPAAPLDAGSLVGAVLRDRVRANPAPLIAVVAALLVLLWARRRA